MVSLTLFRYTDLTKYRSEYHMKYTNKDDLLYDLLKIASYSTIQPPDKIEFEEIHDIKYIPKTLFFSNKEQVEEIHKYELKVNVIFDKDLDEKTNRLWLCLINAYFWGIKRQI